MSVLIRLDNTFSMHIPYIHIYIQNSVTASRPLTNISENTKRKYRNKKIYMIKNTK